MNYTPMYRQSWQLQSPFYAGLRSYSELGREFSNYAPHNHTPSEKKNNQEDLQKKDHNDQKDQKDQNK